MKSITIDFYLYFDRHRVLPLQKQKQHQKRKRQRKPIEGSTHIYSLCVRSRDLSFLQPISNTPPSALPTQIHSDWQKGEEKKIASIKRNKNNNAHNEISNMMWCDWMDCCVPSIELKQNKKRHSKFLRTEFVPSLLLSLSPSVSVTLLSSFCG